MDYTSSVKYSEEPLLAAAVYCSDGRVGDQFDDFLHHGLGLPRYDKISLPGGPARLAGHPDASFNERAVIDELVFLVEAHGLTRVVLIQHEGCAFYQHRLGVQGEELQAMQDADLTKAANAIRDATGLTQIDGYYAKRTTDGVRFKPVPLDIDDPCLDTRNPAT